MPLSRHLWSADRSSGQICRIAHETPRLTMNVMNWTVDSGTAAEPPVSPDPPSFVGREYQILRSDDDASADQKPNGLVHAARDDPAGSDRDGSRSQRPRGNDGARQRSLMPCRKSPKRHQPGASSAKELPSSTGRATTAEVRLARFELARHIGAVIWSTVQETLVDMSTQQPLGASRMSGSHAPLARRTRMDENGLVPPVVARNLIGARSPSVRLGRGFSGTPYCDLERVRQIL